MLETIATLSESKLFPSIRNLDKYSTHDLGELAYLYFIGLRILLCEKETETFARNYCRKTIGVISFNRWRTDGTDLYALMYALIEDRRHDPKKDEPFEERLVISPYKFYNWLSLASTDKATEAITKSLFVKLDNIFNIHNSSMRSIRRLVMDWTELDKHEKQLAVTRYLQILRSRAPRSEILPQMTKLAKEQGLEMYGVCDLETGVNCSIAEKPKKPKGGLLAVLAGMAVASAFGKKKSYKESASAGATSSANVASISGGIGSLGAGFAPNETERSVYPSKTKKKAKMLVIKR